jgi:hypothetical protein
MPGKAREKKRPQWMDAFNAAEKKTLLLKLYCGLSLTWCYYVKAGTATVQTGHSSRGWWAETLRS